MPRHPQRLHEHRVYASVRLSFLECRDSSCWWSCSHCGQFRRLRTPTLRYALMSIATWGRVDSCSRAQSTTRPDVIWPHAEGVRGDSLRRAMRIRMIPRRVEVCLAAVPPDGSSCASGSSRQQAHGKTEVLCVSHQVKWSRWINLGAPNVNPSNAGFPHSSRNVGHPRVWSPICRLSARADNQRCVRPGLTPLLAGG